MGGNKLAWLWAALAVFLLLFFLGVYGQLPPVVATHFDAVGNPNGWQTKGAFISVFLPLILGTNALFVLLSFLSDRLPPERMNLPHKQQWLATPGNRSLARQKLREGLLETAVFLNLALLFAVQSIYQQNVPGAGIHIPFLAGLVFILGGVVVLAVRSILRFLKPPPAPPENVQ